MWKKQPFEPIEDGRGSWRQGPDGLLLRLRTLVTAVIIGLISGGWLAYREYFSSSNSMILKPEIALWQLVLIIVAVLWLAWSITRRKVRHSLQMKWQLHEIAHFLRDEIGESEQMNTSDGSMSKEQTSHYILSRCDAACNIIRNYFREMVEDETVECCIRLADKHSSSSSEVLFGTSGRSDGLSKGRCRTSEPISGNIGLPAYFHEKRGRKGIVIIHDIEESAKPEYGIFKLTGSEQNKDFRKEINTLTVAPINGWSAGQERMIGLFYVCSQKDPFKVKHADPVRLVSDMLGIAIPRIIDNLCDKRSKLFSFNNQGEEG